MLAVFVIKKGKAGAARPSFENAGIVRMKQNI